MRSISSEPSSEPFAACLYASYCYEAQLFDDHIFRVVRDGVEYWRVRFRDKLQNALDQTSPRLPTTAQELSSMILAIFEGSFILGRILDEPRFIAEQLRQYRKYLELLFARAETKERKGRGSGPDLEAASAVRLSR